jgi:acyl-ACP thioesterase
LKTWVSSIERCFAYREFLVRNHKKQITVRASSRWIFYNIKKKKPAKIQPVFFDHWKIYTEIACLLTSKIFSSKKTSLPK